MTKTTETVEFDPVGTAKTLQLGTTSNGLVVLLLTNSKDGTVDDKTRLITLTPEQAVEIANEMKHMAILAAGGTEKPPLIN